MNTARTENTGSQAFAARMAYELAYGEEQVFRTSTIAANSLTVKGAPASAAYVISDAESRQEHARFARIALYELEKARGTPPDKIYDKLQALSVIQPAFQ